MKAVLIRLFLLCTLVAAGTPMSAQTNVRAWYADGQVWVVWETGLPLPETYGIYASIAPFSQTTDAVLIGRPFHWEYLGGALKQQVDSTLTLRIPDGQGGIYQLALNEGLFVATPHQAGSLWLAVTAWGETAVTAGVNGTAAPVSFAYDPVGDPVECHLQAVFPSPFAPAYTCLAYYLWADGRQAQWDNRPDFPVMANAAKNGMPSLFLVGVSPLLDTTQAFPLSIWLHGGGGEARQSLPGSRPVVNIRPRDGILVAHNDDLIGWRGLFPPNPESPSWHFGWRKNYDPFTSGNEPLEVDTIVNYTQRRYIWIDAWLMRHFNIDPHRINIHGHSMGSAGTTALAKVFPEHYASATLFNNGFGGPVSGTNVAVFGEPDQNYPTNLVDRFGATVRLLDLWNLIDNCAPARDWPYIRSYHGKNDDNETMQWDAYVVENYRRADSTATGAALFWSERNHDMEAAPALGDHWILGTLPAQQTATDDVATGEMSRADRSFPAFYNHRLEPEANDPGDGTLGTGGSGVGDDWGSWGGWHRWDWNAVEESEHNWSVVAWLESNAVFPNDNCPFDILGADVAIRKPTSFRPATGASLYWQVRDAASGEVLQSGTTAVQPDELVSIPQVEVYRENLRRVRIEVSDLPLSAQSPGIEPFSALKINPNPSTGEAVLTVFSQNDTKAEVRAIGTTGTLRVFPVQLVAGANRLPLRDFAALPAGLYFVGLVSGGGQHGVVKWIKR